MTVATRVWYSLLAAVAAVTVIGEIVLTAQQDKDWANFFSTFSMQSELLVLAMSVVLVLHPLSPGTRVQILRLGVLVGITVSGSVYGWLIAPHDHLSPAWMFFESLLHYVSPVLVILGFLFLEPRVAFARKHLLFILWPIAWLAYTLIRAAVSHPNYVRDDGTFSRYPYDFLDVDLHGWTHIIINIVVLTVLFLLLASVFIGISRLLARPAGRRGDRAVEKLASDAG
jgi:hypothetical protein